MSSFPPCRIRPAPTTGTVRRVGRSGHRHQRGLPAEGPAAVRGMVRRAPSSVTCRGRRLRSAGAAPRRGCGCPSGRQSGLLSDAVDSRPGARRRRWAHRVRHHCRRQIGRIRRGQERGREVPFHRGERERARLSGRRPSPHAGDRAGAWAAHRQRDLDC